MFKAGLPTLGLCVLAGPRGLTWLPDPGLSTALRTQAEARIRDTQARSAVIARSPLLGSSLLR